MSAPTSPTPAALPPWPSTPLTQAAAAVARRLAGAGHEAWCVGGCVRDWLRGAAMKDLDIATDAPPAEVARLFPGAKGVGAHFGVSIVSAEGHAFEVATFRSEGSYVDRRRPSEVRYGTRDEDWPRRDFTINAMYYDPLNATIFDPAGGRTDLAAGRLRTVGDPARRFEEDALRLLRAVRFAARCGLALDPATAAAIRTHAPGLAEISVERIAEELVRILTGPQPGSAMRMMGDLGLWPFVIPEVEAMRGVAQPANFHPEGDVFVHTSLVLDALAEHWHGPPPPALALGALLHDVGKPPTFEAAPDRIRFPEHQRVGADMARHIGRRLRLPTRLTERAAELVHQHMRFMDAPRMKRSTLRQFLGQPDFDLHLALHQADCLGSHGKLDAYDYCQARRREFAENDRDAALLPDPLLGGRDLIALGMQPGPALGRALASIRELQLEGDLTTREDALAWARANALE